MKKVALTFDTAVLVQWFFLKLKKLYNIINTRGENSLFFYLACLL
ncbi:hypothetical protein IGJ68_003009 [Enterococcus sp. DIV0564]